MEGYPIPTITREDAAEAENVFLSITSDGDIYKKQLPLLARAWRNGADDSARHILDSLVHGYANSLERQELCNGPISYLARAVAAVWLESYYRDHVAEGGLAA